jgi:hypothetical protein
VIYDIWLKSTRGVHFRECGCFILMNATQAPLGRNSRRFILTGKLKVSFGSAALGKPRTDQRLYSALLVRPTMNIIAGRLVKVLYEKCSIVDRTATFLQKFIIRCRVHRLVCTMNHSKWT